MAFWQSPARWAQQPRQKKPLQFKALPWVLARASTCRACLSVKEIWADTLVLTPPRVLGSLGTQGEPTPPPHPTHQRGWLLRPLYQGAWLRWYYCLCFCSSQQNLLALKICSSKEHKSSQNWGRAFTSWTWVLKGQQSPNPWTKGRRGGVPGSEAGSFPGPEGPTVARAPGRTVAPQGRSGHQRRWRRSARLSEGFWPAGERQGGHQLPPFPASSLATMAPPSPCGSDFITTEN